MSRETHHRVQLVPVSGTGSHGAAAFGVPLCGFSLCLEGVPRGSQGLLFSPDRLE